MPDGKAQALLHVLGRETGLPTVVARKTVKAYMAEPILSVPVQSVTTAAPQFLYLDGPSQQDLRDSYVIIVDDVISTGGTLSAMKSLAVAAGAKVIGVMAVFTEGTARPDVISLGHLPLFADP